MLRTYEETLRREAGTLATILDQLSWIQGRSDQQNSSFAQVRPRNRNRQKLGRHLRRVKLTSTGAELLKPLYLLTRLEGAKFERCYRRSLRSLNFHRSPNLSSVPCT
jgi:hypothetical protein